MSVEPQLSGEENQEAAALTNANLEQSQNEQTQEDQMVPLSALQSEREQRQHLGEELNMIKDHLALMQSQQAQAQRPQQEQDALDEGDVLTYGEFKKLTEKKERQYEQVLSEMKMAQQHPDYQEVVQKYLPNILRKNPELRSKLESTQDHQLAYYLAKNSDEYKADHMSAKKSAEAERIIKNSQQAGSLSSMGATTPISQAKQYKDMSDDEFKKLVNRNIGAF